MNEPFKTGEKLLLDPHGVAVEYRGPTADKTTVRVRVDAEPWGGAQIGVLVSDLHRPADVERPTPTELLQQARVARASRPSPAAQADAMAAAARGACR